MSNESSYASGNCTWWAAKQATWVPAGWGNAAEWWSHAQQAGFKTGATPATGAVAVWGPGIDPPWGYGHVGVVTAVRPDGSWTVSEMNWKGLGQVDQRNVSDRANLLGFIYSPGTSSAPGGTAAAAGGSDPFGIMASAGQLVSAGQVAGGAVLIVAALALAVLLIVRRP